MSDDNRGVRGPAAKLTTSEKRVILRSGVLGIFNSRTPTVKSRNKSPAKRTPTRMREMRPNSVETGHGPVIETDQTPANLMVASAICSCAPALLRGSGDLIERA